jgi:hypothetical protein
MFMIQKINQEQDEVQKLKAYEEDGLLIYNFLLMKYPNYKLEDIHGIGQVLFHASLLLSRRLEKFKE